MYISLFPDDLKNKDVDLEKVTINDFDEKMVELLKQVVDGNLGGIIFVTDDFESQLY